MARNVEIKARLADLAQTEAIAASMSGGPRTILRQVDVFYPTPKGRLKLRILGPSQGQLIYYERPDQSGPKTSNYSISYTESPLALESVLRQAYGVRGEVRKERRLYMVGRTRIHLDIVEGLGDFIELEVVLGEAEPAEAGERIAHQLMEKLGVRHSDLIESAYIDLLEAADGREE